MRLSRVRRGFHQRQHLVAQTVPFKPGGAGDIDLSKVKQLWCDLSGSSVMDAAVRHRLVRSRGPCLRHAWAMAIVGNRAARWGAVYRHDPLRGPVGLAATALASAAHPGDDVRTLTPRDVCMTCDYGSLACADPMFEEKTRRANDRQRTRAMLTESRQIWSPQACPFCVVGGTGLPCLPHLLAGATRIPSELPAYLSALGPDCRSSRSHLARPGGASRHTRIVG